MKRHLLRTSLYFLAVLLLIPLFAVPDIGQNQTQDPERDRYQAAIEQKAKIDAIFEAQTEGILIIKNSPTKAVKGK